MGSTTETADVAASQILLFGVSGRAYGCAIDAVREIIPFRAVTRLPGSPPYVSGLSNIRGTIVTVLDLGLRFGAAPVDRAAGSVVLVEHESKIVGLGVDDVRDVRRFGVDDVEAVVGESDGVVRGVVRAGDEVAVLLDVQALVREVLL